MAADNQGPDPKAPQGETPPMETFGPVTSLEPDAPTPTAGGDPQAGLVVPLGSDNPPARAVDPGKAGEKRGKGVRGDSGKRRLAHLLERIRGQGDEAPGGPGGEQASGADWSPGAAAKARRAPPARAEEEAAEAAALEDAESVFLLDDAFLKREFKEVAFPASKELVLRYVDMEQDFAFGQDRTVNLHNLITHLEQDAFQSRKELLAAIHARLAQPRHAK